MQKVYYIILSYHRFLSPANQRYKEQRQPGTVRQNLRGDLYRHDVYIPGWCLQNVNQCIQAWVLLLNQPNPHSDTYSSALMSQGERHWSPSYIPVLVSITQCSEASHAVSIKRCLGCLCLITHTGNVSLHQLPKPGMDSEELSWRLLSFYFIKKTS